MSYYTTPTLVEAELQANAVFSGVTVPSLLQVTTWITEESGFVDHLTADVYTQTTNTEYLDYNGEEYLLTRHTPIISVQTLEYNAYPLGSSLGESWSTKTVGTDYIVNELRGEIILPMTTFVPSDGRRRFRITYSSGYTTTPSVVQKLTTKLVADRVLSSLLNANINEGTDGGSISVGSISIVEPASYGVQNYRRLKDDISQLKNEVALRTGVYRY